MIALGPGAARIGFVGLGMMGRPMAQRLAAGGYDLVVLDRRHPVAEAFAAEQAAAVATDLPEMARSCHAVITMLPTGADVATVVAGEGGCLLDGAAPGTVIMDMSSSEPAGTRALGARTAANGVTLIDAPVSGGVPKATSGELTVLVGGPADAADRCRPLLSRLSRQIFHTGELGTAHAMKALNNLLSAAGFLATAEVLMLGTRVGLEPSLMLDVLNASTGRNNSTEAKFGPYVLSGTYDSGFGLDLMVKDLRTALGLAHDADTPAPLSAEVLARCEQAQAALGRGADHTAVAMWWQDVAGSRYDGGRPDRAV